MDNNVTHHDIVWTDENIGRFWDYYSTHKPYSDQYFMDNYGYSILSTVKKSVDLEAKKILDFGSGPGFFLDKIINQKIDCNYFALDFSQSSVDVLKRRYSHSTVLQDAQVVQSLPSPYIDSDFDIVLSFEVIEHITQSQLESMLRDIYRVLKKGGVFVASTPNNENLELDKNYCPECGCVYHKWQHVTSWNREKLESVFSKLGFHTQKIIETEFYTYPQHRLKRQLKILHRQLFGNFINRKPHMLYIGTKV